jgi:arabinose-5-phosphate isomerase
MRFKEFCQVLSDEGAAIQAAANRYLKEPKLAESIDQSIQLILDRTQAGGKLILMGIGKSGKVAAKIAATLSSTGTPAIFVHPTEALHGDLGVVTPNDVVMAFSYTGNTEELLEILPFFERKKIPVIGIGGNTNSKLAQKSLYWIDASVEKEACPNNLAPTTSTTLALAIGDAFAVSLLQARGFSTEDFAKNHPGGSLGKRLQLIVKDLMHAYPHHCPVIKPDAQMDEVLELSTQKKLGGVLVCEGQKLLGIITDGDIRRALKHREKFFSLSAKDVMTQNPITVTETLLAFDALRIMEERDSQISVLPVVNENHEAVGLLRIHDLFSNL